MKALFPYGRHSGLMMVSALDSGSSSQGSGPGRAYCVVFVFLGKTLHSHSAGESNAGGNSALDWHPIQAGVRILLVASVLQKPEISAGLMGLLGL